MPGDKYAVEMLNITKTFLNGKIVANKDVNFRVKKNEVHALIGENGAGKSTLMSILFGLYSPDHGQIKINGEPVYFYSAYDATRAGLGMVHQHFKLVKNYSILKNVILGSEVTTMLDILQTKDVETKLVELIDKYKLGLDVKAKVKDININQQQKTEILKLLYKDLDILIFDEPTSILNDYEIELFLEMIKSFKDEGKTIIIISHKLNEIKEVSDRATILRLGKTIETFDINKKSLQEVADLMVGKHVKKTLNDNAGFFSDEIVLDVQNIVLGKESNPTSLKIHKGEVYAVAGVENNGQKQLALQISGLDNCRQGSIFLDKQDITKISIKKRYAAGLSHIPEDNRGHGMILDQGISDNIVMQEIGSKEFSSYGIRLNQKILNYAKNVVNKYDVRGADALDAPVRGLSGGNQQKMIVGREFERKHKLVMMVQPTKGLDVGAISYIHGLILKEKAKGNAVLLISYDLDEILSLADTVAVISKNEIIYESNIRNTSRSEIGFKIAGN